MSEDMTLVGALVLAVTTLAGAIGLTARALWVKLFDSEKGLAMVLVNRHLRFVDESAEAMRVNSSSQSSISAAVTEISEAVKRTAEATENQEKTNLQIAGMLAHQHEELTGFSKRFQEQDEFSTVRTNAAIHHLARAGRAHLEGKDDDCLRELNEAEKVVNGKI